ncbi:Septum site-determining protein DivIVA [Sporomusa ovata DSM 2662]|uniref:Cell division initiation protein DivIVA n=1 Tax=Sporomusa ovata TaxID=2378 RepID=A0A0U1L627_9FIRM|nr:DivIVA domain-containing protein [Sporomusa ovata]EQB26026.1 septum site-determining protein DivIVA [Sporomusa ovata DSM 2662]CQR74603.1 Cell division initiation protein DivIVA [Sporomusa ovata]
MLTPLDIHNKEFKRSFRGYKEDEVDEFLDGVIKDYETLYRDNIEGKETIERLNSKLEHYQHMENTLHSTLVIAQETAEEVKLNAKKETELIIKEAEIRAQKLVEEALTKVRKMTGEYEELQKQAKVFRTRLRTLLQAQMEMLNNDDEDEN